VALELALELVELAGWTARGLFRIVAAMIAPCSVKAIGW
jgi:hypothetical protein